MIKYLLRSFPPERSGICPKENHFFGNHLIIERSHHILCWGEIIPTKLVLFRYVGDLCQSGSQATAYEIPWKRVNAMTGETFKQFLLIYWRRSEWRWSVDICSKWKYLWAKKPNAQCWNYVASMSKVNKTIEPLQSCFCCQNNLSLVVLQNQRWMFHKIADYLELAIYSPAKVICY